MVPVSAMFNPKAVLFAAAVLIALFPGGLSAANSFLIAVNHLLIELSFYTTLAFCLSTHAVAGRFLRAKTWIDRGAAAVLGALGVRLPRSVRHGARSAIAVWRQDPWMALRAVGNPVPTGTSARNSPA